ncbi:MAG: hypothetical protein WCK06_09785 [Actinomycetota bacterium]
MVPPVSGATFAGGVVEPLVFLVAAPATEADDASTAAVKDPAKMILVVKRRSAI